MNAPVESEIPRSKTTQRNSISTSEQETKPLTFCKVFLFCGRSFCKYGIPNSQCCNSCEKLDCNVRCIYAKYPSRKESCPNELTKGEAALKVLEYRLFKEKPKGAD